MESQLAKDWSEMHAGLVDRHPDILGGLSLADYRWALSTIWSRAVGVDRDGRCVRLICVYVCTHACPLRVCCEPYEALWRCALLIFRTTQNKRSYLRVLAPALDMCNHDPHAASHLDELLQLDPTDDCLALQTGSSSSSTGGVAPGQQCHLFYGPYSNAKLLYSYGFVSARNGYRGVDWWVRVPPQGRDAQWKEEQRRAHALTAEQTYDFGGTLRGSE